MNDFSVSRPGGFRAGPKLSCSTILKSLKLDTAQPRSGRGGQSRRKSFSHYKLYNQRVRAGAGGSLWEPQTEKSFACFQLYNNTVFHHHIHFKNFVLDIIIILTLRCVSLVTGWADIQLNAAISNSILLSKFLPSILSSLSCLKPSGKFSHLLL